MTDLQTAAQQALEALERYQVKRQDFDRFADEITALKAALAEPQEPVAWLHTDPDKPRVKFLEWHKDEPGYRGRWIKTPLYSAPPQRKPLSDEELDRLWREPMSADWEHREYARAIERAHGIKEEK